MTEDRDVRPGAMSWETLRSRYNAFIDRHEVAWEVGMALLAIAFVVVGVAVDNPGPDARLLEAIDLGLTAVFVAEFASRFAAAADRSAYLRGHWIDLAALVPTIRGLRVLRLIRLLRLVRAFAGVYRALMSVERLAGHRGLIWLFAAWLGVAVICSIALYAAENGVNDAVRSPADALWWGVVTLTTVGYGDVYPMTPEGRLAAGALMVLGITLFSGITATITSFMVSTSAGSADDRDPAGRLSQIGELRERGLITPDEFEAKKAELLPLL
jgi:voltage-gated potassium channel